MNVVVLINGREAIPVRAIPLVTGGRLSPDTLVDALIPVNKFPDPMQLEALRVEEGAQLWSKFDYMQWEGIRDRLERLSKQLNPKKKSRHKTQADWTDGAINLLPDGVFLWREDLERCIQAFDMRDCYEERAVFDFSPHIHCDLRKSVLEGFEHLLPVDASPVPAEHLVARDGGRTGAPAPATLAQHTEIPGSAETEAEQAQRIDQQEPAEAARSERPPFQQPFQEQEILRVISTLGHTATELPRRIPGKPWIKANVRGRLLHFSDAVFNKAWDRLRKDGRVKEAA